MKLKNCYNVLADRYEQSHTNDVISTTHDIAISHLLPLNWEKQVIDLGIGTGNFLCRFAQHFPHAKLTGVDISPNMLKIAKKKLALNTVCSELNNINQYLPANQFELVLAHYILAYTGLEALLKNARYLLANEGYLSLITTTFDLLPASQKRLREIFCSSPKKFNSLFKKIYTQGMLNDLAPHAGEMEKKIIDNGFTIVKRQQFSQEMIYNSAQEQAKWSIDGGWLAAIMASTPLPLFLFKMLLSKFLQYNVNYPFKDQYIAEIFLLKKNGSTF